MASTVRYIRAVGIHGRYDLELEFNSGVNILYGKNGTGKTTLLHILANILNGDFERFAFLPFDTIEVHLDDKQKIKLRQYTHSEGNKIDVSLKKEEKEEEIASFAVSETKEIFRRKVSRMRRAVLPTAYFPAFRTLIEASGQEEETPLYRRAYEEDFRRAYEEELRRRYFEEAKTVLGPVPMNSTHFARRFFGDFVPFLNYPSPEEVSRRLSAEMQKALNDIASTDRQLLSQAFLDIFATLSEDSNPDVTQFDQILEEIRHLLKDTATPITDPTVSGEVYSQLRDLVPDARVRLGKEETYVPILEVYKSSLKKRASVQEESLRVINTYLNSVNNFLDGKQLTLRKKSSSSLPTLLVTFGDPNLDSKIQALSSGERQIVTLLYSVTHMSGRKVVLIDEPEISLHIDWQRLLIPEMAAQLQDVQIITCTHSPMIGSKYENQMIKLEIKPTGHNGTHDREDIEEDSEEEL